MACAFSIANCPRHIFGIIYLLLPESTRWLCSRGRNEQGLATPARLPKQGNGNDAYVQEEFRQITIHIDEAKGDREKTYMDLFKSTANLRRILLVMMIQAGCKRTRVSAIQNFSLEIFTLRGISTGSTLLFVVINACLSFCGTTGCILTIDRIGRRPLEIYGSYIMAGTFLVNAALIKQFPAANLSCPHNIYMSDYKIYTF